MSYYPHGKHVTIDVDNPESVGICDYTGFVFLRKDLVRQMEWRGEDLVWTGFYVGRPYADVPNEQNRVPILPPDPIAIVDPRPPFMSYITWDQDQDLFNQDTNIFGNTVGLMINAPALPEAQRRQQLENYNWGFL